MVLTTVKAHQTTNSKTGAKQNVKEHSRNIKGGKNNPLQDNFVDPFENVQVPEDVSRELEQGHQDSVEAISDEICGRA